MHDESLVWLIEADHRREEAHLARLRAFALARAARPGSRSRMRSVRRVAGRGLVDLGLRVAAVPRIRPPSAAPGLER